MTTLYVAFVWHMHQPYYRDPYTGLYRMPWVRLHGVKDYYDMAALLEEFPRIHATFNLVPSLLKQILDYTSEDVLDRELELTLKRPSELSEAEQAEILDSFFTTSNPDQLIRAHPRYAELLRQRDRGGVDRFREPDWWDLQVWRNLSWVDPLLWKEPEVRRLLEKGRGFDEKDKADLVHFHRTVLSRIVPTYCTLRDRGQIELTTSPFYHPILPLLCDTHVARESLSGTSLPVMRFQHSEDAQWHVEEGIRYFEGLFGQRPRGMWPSEGGVSEQVIPILHRAGIQWIATDEEILAKSLGIPMKRDRLGCPTNPEVLYQPYRYVFQDGEMTLIFRDHVLSDAIGFVYAQWAPGRSVEDFVGRLKAIRERLAQHGRSQGLVSVVLDGENCWESYSKDGADFLRGLYTRLSEQEGIETITVGEALQAFPSEAVLKRLHPGSWINASFQTWVGHSEDNRAWDLLSQARAALVEAMQSGRIENDGAARAWEEIYIAEGSDWCWWYGDEHSSPDDERFDELFRAHLRRVYDLVGMECPGDLLRPIRKAKVAYTGLTPLEPITPDIDGIRSHFYEWAGAGFFDPRKAGGAMHQITTLVKGIYFGGDAVRFCLRVDVQGAPGHMLENRRIVVLLDDQRRMVVSSLGEALLEERRDGAWTSVNTEVQAAVQDCVELSVPFSDLGCSPGDALSFQVALWEQGKLLEIWPRYDRFEMVVPDEAFLAEPW